MHKHSKRSVFLSLLVFAWLGAPCRVFAEQTLDLEHACNTLRHACDFFRKHVADHGGYLWRYSADLKQREGEKSVEPNTVWVQPPGTPSVGLAYLTAFDATGDQYYLDAATDVGICLVNGQLRSGGWDYRIDFKPNDRKKYAYRADPKSDTARNVTTLDDNTTQEAARFLMRLDKTLEFKNKKINEATQFALSSLLKAQYPNGAWPQRYDHFPDPKQFPVKKANYPTSWPRTHPKENYRDFYTFNDNAIADVIDVMFLAEIVYKDAKYRVAAERAGDFILLAQMPQPQPAWAQQYSAEMQPVWARRFEPPAVTGGESQGVLRTLLRLYKDTGQKKYIEPIPRAIAYLQSSQLSDGRLARFYELNTNRPLYFTTGYELTYDDSDLPTHYAFKISSKLESIEREYQLLLNQKPEDLAKPPSKKKPSLSKSLQKQVQTVISGLDDQGRWTETGQLKYQSNNDVNQIVDCRTFVKNVEILSRYITASR